MKRMRRYVAHTLRRSDVRQQRLSLTLPLIAFFVMVLGHFMVLASEDQLQLEYAVPRIWQSMLLAGLLSVVLARRRM